MNKKMLEQKLMGIGMILVSLVVIYMAATAIVPGDSDATAAVIFLPIGLYLMLSRKVVIY